MVYKSSKQFHYPLLSPLLPSIYCTQRLHQRELQKSYTIPIFHVAALIYNILPHSSKSVISSFKLKIVYLFSPTKNIKYFKNGSFNNVVNISFINNKVKLMILLSKSNKVTNDKTAIKNKK